MACMDHHCTRCEWSACDNHRRHALCPTCGAAVISTFDEPPDCDEGDYIGEYPDLNEDNLCWTAKERHRIGITVPCFDEDD